MNEISTKGDLVIIPQKVAMIKLDESGMPVKFKQPEKPIAVLVYEVHDSFTDVLYDNEIWTVANYQINKGGTYASKTDRSL